MSILPDQQTLLWLFTLCIDLGSAILLFRFFGKQGLYASIILSLLLANLQGPKLTQVLGMQTSVGVILYSGIYFATDLLSERYGRREANRAVILGFAVSLIIIVMISLSMKFLPSTNLKTADFAASIHEAMGTLFNFTPRFICGSLLAYLISQSFDVWIYHVIKTRTQGKHLWLRNNLSTMLSQLIDTSIYGLVVWWGIVDFTTAMQLAMAKYFFKVLIALIDTPFIYVARSWDVSRRDWIESPDTRSREKFDTVCR